MVLVVGRKWENTNYQELGIRNQELGIKNEIAWDYLMEKWRL
jgi:hypothetical protein